MPVISIKNELNKASQQHYAIPLFNVFEMGSVEGLASSIARLRAPSIIGIYSGTASQPNGKPLAAYVRARFENIDVPVTIMLDHGSSVELCIRVLEYGFTDVMYDGSTLPFEENIANTRRVVQAAHAVGAAVEAELGHVGSGADYDHFGSQAIGFTEPDQVEKFVDETGVDFLAIAFGNAHGLYKGEPRLDLELVRTIRARVDLPLVMHGGTGVSDAQFRDAIAAGISKINYVTNIVNSATAYMKTAAQSPDGNLFTMTQGVTRAYEEWSEKLFSVFGTAGKA